MCGRKTLTKSKIDIANDFLIESWDKSIDYNINFNIAPQQKHPVFIKYKNNIQVRLMKWGLVPEWVKDEKNPFYIINARQETLLNKLSFKNLLNVNRCLIPVDGYYEWKNNGKFKQPYYIYKENHQIFFLVGLWSTWRYKDFKIDTYTVITTKSDKNLSKIHKRMPVIQESNMMDWLDITNRYESYNFSSIKAKLKFHPVSKFVNSTMNNSSECIKEININFQDSLF